MHGGRPNNRRGGPSPASALLPPRAAHVKPKTVFLNRNTQTLNNRTARMKAFNFEPGRVFNSDLRGEEHAMDDAHVPTQEDVILGNDPGHRYIPLPSIFSDVDSESCWPGPAADDRSLLGNDVWVDIDDEARPWKPGEGLTLVKYRKKKGSAAAAASRGEDRGGPSSDTAYKNKTSVNKNDAKQPGGQGRAARAASADKKSSDELAAYQKSHSPDHATAGGADSEADPALPFKQGNTSGASPCPTNAMDNDGNKSDSSDSDNTPASGKRDKSDDTFGATHASSKWGWGARPMPEPAASFSLDPLTFPGLPGPTTPRNKLASRARNGEVDWSTVRNSPGVQPGTKRNSVGGENGKTSADGAPKNGRAPAGCWGRGWAGRGGADSPVTGEQPRNAWCRGCALGMGGNGPGAATPGGGRGSLGNGGAGPKTTTTGNRPDHQRREFNPWDQIVPPENQLQLTEYRGAVENGGSRGNCAAAQRRHAKGKPGTNHNSSGRGADVPAECGRGNGRIAPGNNAWATASSNNKWKDGRRSEQEQGMAWRKGPEAATGDGKTAASDENPDDDAQKQKQRRDKEAHDANYSNRFPAAPATAGLPPRKPMAPTMLVQARPVGGSTNKVKYVQESMARRVPGCPEWDRAATHTGIQLTAREMEMLNDTATVMQSWDDADDVRIRRLPRPSAAQQAPMPEQDKAQTEAATAAGTAVARHAAQMATTANEAIANDSSTGQGEGAITQRGADDKESATTSLTSALSAKAAAPQEERSTQDKEKKQPTDTASQQETPVKNKEKKQPSMWLSAATKTRAPSQPQDVRCLPNYATAASTPCRAEGNAPEKQQWGNKTGAASSAGPMKMPSQMKLKGVEDASKPHNLRPCQEQGGRDEHPGNMAAGGKKKGQDVAWNQGESRAKNDRWCALSTVGEIRAMPINIYPTADAGCTGRGDGRPNGEGTKALTSHTAASPSHKQPFDLSGSDDDDDWAAGDDDYSSAPVVRIGTKSNVLAPSVAAVSAYNMVRGSAKTADRPAASGKRVAAGAPGRRDEGCEHACWGGADAAPVQFVNVHNNVSMDFGVVLENQGWGSEIDF